MQASLKRKSVRKALLAALSGLVVFASVSPSVAQDAGSVDGELARLARQIVDKSVTADRKTIGVLPFPNADGTCSVLSTYLADELILRMFSVPNSPVTIIGRSRLEALISEIAVGEGGLLNPETARELGSISGVQALTAGMITVVGDTVRVNTRLVDTQTGRIISAAGVTVPRTNAVTQLLQQPAACGRNSIIDIFPASAGNGSPFGPGGVGGTTYKVGNVAMQVINITRDGVSEYKVVGTMTNTSEAPLKVMLLAPTTMLDQLGNVAEAKSSTGVLPCMFNRTWQKDHEWCGREKNQQMEYTVLTPALPRYFAVTFGVRGNKRLLGAQAALTGRILITGDTSIAFPINFPGLPLPSN